MSIGGPSSYPVIAPTVRKDQNGIGRVRTEVYTGELVSVPFRQGHAGVGTLLTQGDYATMSRDGSNSYILFSSTAADWSSDNTISYQFRGRVLGVRFDPGIVANASLNFYKGLSVMIDRVAYRCPKPVWDPVSQSVRADPDGYFGSIITTDLPDGLHLLELGTTSDASSANDTYIYGLLLERRAGYRDEARYATPCAPYTLGTSNVAMLSGFSTAKRTPRGVTKLFYNNTTGGSVTVTWRFRGTDFNTFTVSAGATVEKDFPTPVSADHYSASANNWLHRSSSATGLICCAIGE